MWISITHSVPNYSKNRHRNPNETENPQRTSCKMRMLFERLRLCATGVKGCDLTGTGRGPICTCSVRMSTLLRSISKLTLTYFELKVMTCCQDSFVVLRRQDGCKNLHSSHAWEVGAHSILIMKSARTRDYFRADSVRTYLETVSSRNVSCDRAL